MPIKVLETSDNEIVRPAMIRMREADTGLDVIGEAATFAKTLELIEGLKPDVVVLDLHMPDEKKYLPRSVKLQVREHTGCIWPYRSGTTAMPRY
jgi:DNA-binding NarL/FixJ family response regulator